MTGGRPARWPDPTPARPGPGPRQGGVWAHLGSPDSASSPIYSPIPENPRGTRNIPRKVLQPPSSSPKQDSGDRSLCSGTLPERGSAPGAISIDSTTIFIAIVVSPDEEGVVLPRG